MNNLALTRLLQLCNPNLPIGGFSFSQGLESAIDSGWIATPDDMHHWVVSAQLNPHTNINATYA